MREFVSDVRFAFRQTGRYPAFAAAAIVTLTLGIGANTAVFSLLNGIWLRPLPFPAQDRLVHVNTTAPKRGRDVVGVSLPDFADWRARSRSIEQMGAFRMARGVLSGQGEARRIAATLMSEEAFAVLGVLPALGRTFRTGEGRPGGIRIYYRTICPTQRLMARPPDAARVALNYRNVIKKRASC